MHDQPLIRSGLISLIELHPLITICAGVGHGPAARQRCADEKPDLIFLALASARGDGMVLLRDFRRLQPAARVVVIIDGGPDEVALAQRSLRAGACGCVSCQDEAAELIAATEAALANRHFASARLAELLLQETARGSRTRPARDLGTLSDREMQVFELLGQGLGATAVAKDMGISVKTVETHQQHLKDKLHLAGCADVKSRAERWLARRG